jgi:hypothetical protein
MNAIYGDAETRGRLRQWKSATTVAWNKMDQLFMDQKLNRDGRAFCLRGSELGRRRAFDRLARLLAPTGAHLEGVRFTGRYPIALWTTIKPRGAVMVTADPSRNQSCVSVNYLLIYQGGDHYNCAEGLWTLEIPDHAMGRLLHRSREEPTAAVLHAHHAALRLRQADILDHGMVREDYRFLLPTKSGAFVAAVVGGVDKRDPDDGFSVHIRCDTWISDDMMFEDQHKVLDDGAPGERLGDSMFLPVPLRTIKVDTEAGTMIVSPSPCRLPCNKIFTKPTAIC